MKSSVYIFILALPLTLLISCSTTQELITPDGDSHQLVSCTVKKDCYADSIKVCAGKYKILSQSSENSSSEGATSVETKMLIQCETSKQ